MVEFRPITWKPPKAPGLVGEFEQNDRLAAAKLLSTPHLGPEDVVVGPTGDVYSGTEDGSIVAIGSDGTARVIAEVGGRPLGIERYGDDLLVCNADLGLQVVSMAGNVKPLTDSHAGTLLMLTNNASIASDGTIYFTESTQRWSLHDYTTDIVEGRTTGRLLRRDPDGSTAQVLANLSFANGVALDSAEASVFVAETARFRIHRHWLAGGKAGTTEVFRDNLPGFPDNVSFSHGTLWVAFASPRNPVVDAMGDKPFLKRVAVKLPEALQPKPLRHGMIIGFDEHGNVTHNLQDPSGRIAITTGVREANGSLYVGALTEPHVAVVDL